MGVLSPLIAELSAETRYTVLAQDNLQGDSQILLKRRLLRSPELVRRIQQRGNIKEP